MARNTNTRIQKPHIILCEGRDAEEFLITYLNSSALSDTPAYSTSFQVMDFGGNSDLLHFLLLLTKMEGFNKVKSILVIRDAERDVRRAVQDIRNAFISANMEEPPAAFTWTHSSVKIGYLLFPKLDKAPEPGTLEDLCLRILNDEQSPYILEQVTELMDHLSSDNLRTFPREFKTKLHTYLSLTDRYVSLKIGEAARANAFCWNSPYLSPLKEFLLDAI